MLMEPTEVCCSRKERKMPITTRRERTVNTVVTDVDLKIVDEAFADLETTTLRRDNPAAAAAASAMAVEQSSPTYHGAVQQLASQLRVLDEQRQRLAQLLHDLQTSPTDET